MRITEQEIEHAKKEGYDSPVEAAVRRHVAAGFNELPGWDWTILEAIEYKNKIVYKMEITIPVRRVKE